MQNLSIEYLDFSEFIKSSINIVINATGHTGRCISILTMLVHVNNYGDDAVHRLYV